MKIASCVFVWAICCCTLTPLFAQTPNLLLSYQKSDSLFVCGSDTFSITIQNNGGDLVAGASLDFALPVGIYYLAGSISGATQQNIANLQHPVFNLPGIPAGGISILKLLISADCAAAAELDGGALFIANISVTAPNANASVLTSSIPVETGLILIESIDSILMEGERCDTLYRKICVKNTRPGKIGNLHFEDLHQSGFEISVAAAETQSNTPAFFEADFDPGFFASAGNHDGWLDQFESVCFTERIIITDCGAPDLVNTSLLRVGWGCGPELCRFDSAYAFIKIKPSTKVPDLLFTQIWNPPTDNCANTGATLGLKIKNQGRGLADNVSVTINIPLSQDKMLMDPQSFRLIGSNGIETPVILNLFQANTLSGCNLSAAESVTLTIPLIEPMDSLELLFELLNCVEACSQKLPQLNVEYFYRKPCPVNGFISEAIKILPDETYYMNSFIGMNVGNCLQSGLSYPAFFYVQSKRLSEPNGFLNVEFDLPHGITLDTTCGTLLGGVAPLASSIVPAAGGGSLVHLTYALPLPFDSTYMNFCLHYECDSNLTCVPPPYFDDGNQIVYASDCAPCFSPVNERAYWTPQLNTPYPCAIGDCHTIFLALDATCSGQSSGGGPVDTSGVVPSLPIGYRWKMDVSRINYGQRDQDDNRSADNGSAALAQEIRLDRYLPGDTSRVEYCGVLDSGEMKIIRRMIWHEVTKSDVFGPLGNDDFVPDLVRTDFTNFQKLRWVHDSMRIHYADGTEVAFSLNDLISKADQKSFVVYGVNSYPPALEDLIVTQRHTFQISLAELFAQGLVTKPTLNAGDSIFFYTDFKMDMNFNPLSPGMADPPLIGFRTAVDHTGLIFAWKYHPFKRLQYSGFITKYSPNTFSIKPCENSLEAKKFEYSIRIARENLFPFEVRPLGRIALYRQTVPFGLTVVGAKLKTLRLQNTIPWYNDITLPFSQTPGQMDVDFNPIFAQPIDEGFSLETNITFGPECHFEAPDSSKQWISTQYFECLNGQFPLVTDTIHNTLGFFANHPELAIITMDSIVYSPTRPFEMFFNLKNPVISQTPFPWITVQSPSGLATDFKLYKMPQNQAIAAQNGVFNIGSLNGFSQSPFRLTGNNISCETDSLLIIFGWDCAPITDLSQTSCYRDTYIVHLNLERPELELDVVEEPESITLCDTSDYFVFEIFNAKTGYAYELFGSADLPDGLRIVNGSSQMLYPTNGVWANVADPELLPGNLYRWNVSESQVFIGANGLPGENFPLQNKVQIRFRTIAECGFVANAQNIYGTYGKEGCGRSTNILNKPGERINIEGLSPTYGVLVNLQPVGNQISACGSEQEFAVQITLLGTPSAGDSAVVYLPLGASFVAGSYAPGQNAPVGPPTIFPGGFRIPLPILAGGGNVQFTFSVAFGPGSGCVDQTLSVQTRVRTEAFCQSLGIPCAVYVSTGEAQLVLQVQHPELGVGDLQMTLNGTQLAVSLELNNIGTYLAPGATAQIWQDLDGNQIVSSGDQLLHTLQSNQIINPGGSIILTGVLNLSPEQLCGLLVVLPAFENCTCTDVVFPVEALSINHTALVYCTLGQVEIGIGSVNGFQYQWEENPGIVCDTCATTLFNPNPDLPPGQQQTLILVATSSGCTVIHRFVVAFGAIASISVNNATICSGQSVTLVANPPNATYTWEGLGIETPGNQIQTLNPLATSAYALTITLPNGCSATATATVTVLPSDTIILPEMPACNGTIIQVFGVDMVATDSLFRMTYIKSNGCDSTVYQSVKVLPDVFIEETLTFCLGQTLMIFDTISVTASTQVCLDFMAFNGCDSTHCINAVAVPPPMLPEQDTIYTQLGQSIALGGLPGYVGYEWTPAAIPPCDNCVSITVVMDSVGFFEYLLTVSDANGCSDGLVWRVVVTPPCDPLNVHIPNAFTPNNDGANDVFQPLVSEGGELIGRLTIYDRWGEKVYENWGNVYWDGTINGVPASSDVYVYIIEVECSSNIVPRVGEVTLLR